MDKYNYLFHVNKKSYYICNKYHIKFFKMNQQLNFNEKSSYKVKSCPINYQQVDKHLIKLYSTIVLLVLIITLLTGNHLGIYLITIDFMIRVFAGIKYSPLCNILTKLMKVTPLKPLLVNAATKKIAAQVGLLFCVFICVFHLLGFVLLTKIFISLFIFAISLDLFFDYCLACKLQSFYLNYFK